MQPIYQSLEAAECRFQAHGIHSPLLDAVVLLAFAINRPREFLYAHPEYEMRDKEIARYEEFVCRRAAREPVAYITNKKEFYCLDFFVDKRVLIPRPETEKIVKNALAILDRSKGPSMVIDVGTGSGCVIVSTVKNSGSFHKFMATDISNNALTVAQKNANAQGVLNQITFLHGNLIEPILNTPSHTRDDFDTIVIAANLPYITPSHYKTLEPEIVRYEPRKALITPCEDPYYYYHLLNKQISALIKRYPVPVHCLYETSDGIQKTLA